ncbi:MAG TPA: HD domain-containing protein [Geobacteraceae bacterium]
MKEGVFLAAALAGTGLVAYAARSLFRPDRNSEPDDEALAEKSEKMTLAEASRRWAGPLIDIADASQLWREREPEEPAEPLPRPTFKHDEIDRFFSDMVEKRPLVKGARRTVIVKLLKILDEEGDCPSVVNKHPLEAEGKLAVETFAMLATIPLYRHTLSVARKCATKIGQEVLLPDFLIVALGHDLGKIPSYHDKMYTSGDHPLISEMILNKITEYASLANRDELDRMVRGHHLLITDNPMTEMFKQCDHEVRRDELATLLSEAMEREREDTRAVSDGGRLPDQGAPIVTEKRAANDPTPPEEQRAHPLGLMESRDIPSPVMQELPSWFDADAVLAAVKTRINRIEETPRGKRWEAVSTNGGLVFVNPDGLWGAIKEVSGADPEVLAADGNEGVKRNLLYTVVCELSRARDAIATEYVAANYYTTQTTVVTGGGRGITVLLVPFRAKAFGESVSTLEEMKPSLLKKMVREIRPKQTEVETCVM